MHFSYILYLHGIAPCGRPGVTSERPFKACEFRRIGPSLLLHPLDLLDHAEAPGVEFFPGMALSASRSTA